VLRDGPLPARRDAASARATGKNRARRDTNNDMRTETTGTTTGSELVRWRRDRLVETGFPVRLAAATAGDSRYDLHALIELVERGCAPELAVRILAPFDREEGH
jgi:hypothetical protein